MARAGVATVLQATAQSTSEAEGLIEGFWTMLEKYGLETPSLRIHHGFGFVIIAEFRTAEAETFFGSI